MIKSLCVFCGSSPGFDPVHAEAARALGTALGQAGIDLVYGGGKVGLMGIVADAAMAAGVRATGVIPKALADLEVAHHGLSALHVVGSMHERKAMMFEQADAFAVFPGGIGTLEEVVELMSWRRLGLHRKPIVFFNPAGFWEPLFTLLRHTVEQKLTPPAFMETWSAVDEVEALLPAMREQAESGVPSPPLVIQRM